MNACTGPAVEPLSGNHLPRTSFASILDRLVSSAATTLRRLRCHAGLTALAAVLPAAVIAQPLDAPFDVRPFRVDSSGASGAVALGFLPRDGEQYRISLGTDLDQGRLIADFTVPFTDGPGEDLAVLTAPYPGGAAAPTILCEFFLGGVLQTAFSATVAPSQVFAFDLPGTGVVADRIIITNITPDPAGINDLGGVAFDDLAVCHAVRPATPAYTLTDLGPTPASGSGALGINTFGDVTGYASGTAFRYSAGQMTDLGTLGGSQSGGNAINVVGTVVGASLLADNTTTHAFIHSGGTMQDLGAFGGVWSEARGINSFGDVVGSYAFSLYGDQHAFLRTQGVMVDLGSLGGSSSAASAINDAGQITGTAALPGNGESHAFIHANRQMIDLGTLGGPHSRGAAINALGEVTGTSIDADGNYRAFLYSQGTMRNLGVALNPPGSIPDSFGFGINRHAQVVGESTGEGVLDAGFLYSDGVMHDVNALIANPLAEPWRVNTANGINDAGQIVGTAFHPTPPVNHGVLLNPIHRPLVGRSGDLFHCQAVTAQTGQFYAEFDAIPSSQSLDAVIGLSGGTPATHRDLAVIVRFNAGGTIDVRNGSAYAAQNRVAYQAGATYHFRLFVDLTTHRYSVQVTPPGGAAIPLATGYAFRTEQRDVKRLDTCALIMEADPPGGATTVGNVSLATLLRSNAGTVRSADRFVSGPMAMQTGTFELTFIAEVSTRPLDGVIGLSQGAATAYTDMAAIVRFAPTGRIDARNGSAYAAAANIPYAAGRTYQFRMRVNLATHRYSVYVMPSGSAEVTVGENFAFRTEQAAVPSLTAWNVIVDPTPARASVTASAFRVTSIALP